MNKVFKELLEKNKPVEPIKPQLIFYANQVSEEEYVIQSKLATQIGLFNAGQQALLKEQREKEREFNRKKVTDYLNNNEWSLSKKGRIFKKYVNFSEEDILTLIKKLSIIQEEYESVNEMNEEYIKEIEELELNTDNKIKGLNERILKLRDRCIVKNKRISYLERVNSFLVLFIVVYFIAYNTISIEYLNFHIYCLILIIYDFIYCCMCIFSLKLIQLGSVMS